MDYVGKEIRKKLSIGDNSTINLLRKGTNTVCSVIPENMVLRIHEDQNKTDIEENLQIVSELSRTSRVLPPIYPTVFSSGTTHVTAWPLAVAAKQNDYEAYKGMGEALKTLHDNDTKNSAFSKLATINLLETIKKRLTALKKSNSIPRYAIDVLEREANKIAEDHNKMLSEPLSVIHRDSHIGNLVHYDGKWVLIDMDNICLGPWQYDFIPTAVRSYRFGQEKEYNALVEGSGKDIREWKFFKSACSIRELTMTTWLGIRANNSRDHFEEFIMRVNTIRNPDDNSLWRAL